MSTLVSGVINFNSAFPTESGIEVRRSEIAKNYMKGWFLIDLISCIPINYILMLQVRRSQAQDLLKQQILNLKLYIQQLWLPQLGEGVAHRLQLHSSNL